MDFEWDAEKDKANLKKHGIAFGEASRDDALDAAAERGTDLWW